MSPIRHPAVRGGYDRAMGDEGNPRRAVYAGLVGLAVLGLVNASLASSTVSKGGELLLVLFGGAFVSAIARGAPVADRRKLQGAFGVILLCCVIASLLGGVSAHAIFTGIGAFAFIGFAHGKTEKE